MDGGCEVSRMYPTLERSDLPHTFCLQAVG